MDRRPIIMTARMGRDDFAWANGLRRQYYPVEHNRVPAHITLFRHLPGHYATQVVDCAKRITAEYAPPSAMLSDVLRRDGGAAYALESPELNAMHDQLAEQFHGLLTVQDQGQLRLHITVQNKVKAAEARAAYAILAALFEPRPLVITGLCLHRYDDGIWEEMGEYGFRGRARAGH